MGKLATVRCVDSLAQYLSDLSGDYSPQIDIASAYRTVRKLPFFFFTRVPAGLLAGQLD